MGSKIVESVTCPKCGGHLFDEEFIDKKMYVCDTENEDGFYCHHILAYCKHCDKLYDESDFGQHGDVWECKECGAVNWPLTEKKREQAAAKKALNSMISNFNNTFGKMGF